jgi:hypothetical protein
MPKPKRTRPPKSGLPAQIVDAIRQAWPDGILEMPIDADESWFQDVYPKLKTALQRIRGSTVRYEHEPESQPHWREDSDSEENLPDWGEEPRSYHVFFLSPDDDRFRIETDTIEPDEDGVDQRFPGEGRIGWVVGVTLVAPFAMIKLDEMEVFENGSRADPDVEPHIFGLDGQQFDPVKHYREIVEDEGLEILRRLKGKIVRALRNCRISLIPEEYLDEPVPWLRAGKEVLVGHDGQSVTVQQAFFFRGI